MNIIMMMTVKHNMHWGITDKRLQILSTFSGLSSKIAVEKHLICLKILGLTAKNNSIDMVIKKKKLLRCMRILVFSDIKVGR